MSGLELLTSTISIARFWLELQANARVPFAELGRRVGLSTPAVIERVHRLEESKVILGYRALVDPAKVGFPFVLSSK
jgi:DNA-binding Lrp family transcriptional regulator